MPHNELLQPAKRKDYNHHINPNALARSGFIPCTNFGSSGPPVAWNDGPPCGAPIPGGIWKPGGGIGIPGGGRNPAGACCC